MRIDEGASYVHQPHDNQVDKIIKDWNWNNELGHSQKISNEVLVRKYYEEEQVMNYTYE